MHQSKWENLLDQIERQFGFVEHETERFDERRLTVETVVFDGAGGRMKLERSVRPVVLDKKSHFAKRVGSAATRRVRLLGHRVGRHRPAVPVGPAGRATGASSSSPTW